MIFCKRKCLELLLSTCGIVFASSIFIFTMQHGKISIIHAAECGRRELVEILFPHTRPVPSLPDWSVDGIIETTKYMPFRTVVCNVMDFSITLTVLEFIVWSMFAKLDCSSSLCSCQYFMLHFNLEFILILYAVLYVC